VIRKATGVAGPLEVVDIRTFVGPESPPSDKNYLMDIRRWYVKLYAKDDLAFQGRFVVEDRRFGRGLAAVAPVRLERASFHPIGSGSNTTGAREGVLVQGTSGDMDGDRVRLRERRSWVDDPRLPAASAGCLDGT
jgi:hypothetical protein